MTVTNIPTAKINELLGVDDSYKAPDKLMELLFDKDKREALFVSFVNCPNRPSEEFDWFHEYFQDEHADRKLKKQDFTPSSVTELLVELAGHSEMTMDVAAGTGGITIAKWQKDRVEDGFFSYRPSNYLYHCEELSDRAIPFLLFNLAYRGMNATVVHGDSLTREIKNVYFVQNFKDDFMSFSSINLMPRSAATEEMFDVRSWLGDTPVEHIEDIDFPAHLAGHIRTGEAE